MPISYQNLLLSLPRAEKLAEQVFGVSGKATLLPGEIDINYKIDVSASHAYILKASRPEADEVYLDFQYQLVAFAGRHDGPYALPRHIPSLKGAAVERFKDDQGRERFVRLLNFIPGRSWHDVNPLGDSLLYSLGNCCGLLTASLQGFTHPMASRKLHWDIAQGLWVKPHLQLFNKAQRDITGYFVKRFETVQPGYRALRTSVVHNDANDYNIVVTEDRVNPLVRALIDFGDAVNTQVINDLAIACTYAIIKHNDPLHASLSIVKGYHKGFPLQDAELEHLYTAIGMRLVISVTKSALNRQKEPGNKYLQVSDAPAWELLGKWRKIEPDFALVAFRHACGFIPHPNEKVFRAWSDTVRSSLNDLFPTVEKTGVNLVDLGVSSLLTGHHDEVNDLRLFQFNIDTLQRKDPSRFLAGGYLEPRALYGTAGYEKNGNNGPENRTIHLGIDFWLPAQTPVHALFDGEVVIAVNDEGDKEYGGLVVLKHRVESLDFFSLYGHLTVSSATRHKPGDPLKAGEIIGILGAPPENGNWVPHLHFQLMLSLFGYKLDYPGVAYPNEIELWKSICPDPNLLFKLEGLAHGSGRRDKALVEYRKNHLGKSLSLQYSDPLHIVRGAGVFLLDRMGKKYLDTVNNVAHVGHEHPAVVRAGQMQMAVLNTNTRYLHENILELTEELLKTLPPELSVLHFVNSGSEANELAMRMAMAATGQKDFVVSEGGYHGNTNLCVAVSPYKFEGRGGKGTPEHTHVFPLPDSFRGRYRGTSTGKDYAGEVLQLIGNIRGKGRGVAALILEPILSCGGQVELPEGFLTAAYQYVRASGGVCISDEVQVGCGRTGRAFWGFQLHGVVPDIITIGKPLGNGHPLAAVACTPVVAEAFANGMEYFNTFGGNPVSCAIGAEVLRTISRENLQENARSTGAFLKESLMALSGRFPIIGDVRGQGLFLGVELVDEKLNPLEQQAVYLVNRMKDYGILMSTDGPGNNVLKIKPPMVFSRDNSEQLLYYLKKVLEEDFMQSR
jgi:4-aminobutyrate aminotransferase-like enzyme/Ser/Thr protein kinase RdoA (MazF antagonist)